MNKFKQISTIFSLLICMVAFQNCGEGMGDLESASSGDVDQVVSLSTSSVESSDDLVISEKGTLGVSRPGYIKKAYVEDGKLKILFYKGLRKRSLQGLKYQNYYHTKWHFEFDDQYFRSLSSCGEAKTANCLLSISLDRITSLKGKTGNISLVTYDGEGNYSESQEGVEVSITEETVLEAEPVVTRSTNLPGGSGYMYTDANFSMVLKNVDDSSTICRVARPEGKVYQGPGYAEIFEELKTIASAQPNGIQDCQ